MNKIQQYFKNLNLIFAIHNDSDYKNEVCVNNSFQSIHFNSSNNIFFEFYSLDKDENFEKENLDIDMPSNCDFYVNDFIFFVFERSMGEEFFYEKVSDFLNNVNLRHNAISFVEFIANKKLDYVNKILESNYNIENFCLDKDEKSILKINGFLIND